MALDQYQLRKFGYPLSTDHLGVSNDQGNISVIEDDGTLITKANRFDLSNLSLTFTPAAGAYAVIANTLKREADARGFALPHITLEPGRSIVARAGMAVYTVGARKEVPGIRTYVSVDGGMADNPRVALYGSQYQAVLPDRPLAPTEELVTIAGKYCESGDILIKDIELPRLLAGELLAMPAAGAYQVSMESNYNLALKAAVVMVEDGKARLIRRRQTFEDLGALDVDE